MTEHDLDQALRRDVMILLTAATLLVSIAGAALYALGRWS